MAWPFSRKKEASETAGGRPQAPRAPDADDAIVRDILGWLQAQHPGLAVHRADDDAAVVHLGAAPPVSPHGPAPAGAVLKVKRGKLSWIDLYDPALRDPVNDLVKHLDRQQKWSFNGVISTRYEA